MTEETKQIIKDDKLLIKMESDWQALEQERDSWKKVAIYLYEESQVYIDQLYGIDAAQKKHDLSKKSGYIKALFFKHTDEKDKDGN